MQMRTKIAAIATAAALTVSLGVVADEKTQSVARDVNVTVKCVDVNTIAAMLKNANYKLMFTGASTSNGEIDSITQTWVGTDGSWVTIEFVKSLSLVCVLASGEQSRISAVTSGKSTWI